MKIFYKLSDRKQDTNDFATLVKEYKELVDDYKKELSDLKTQVDALKKAKDDNYEEKETDIISIIYKYFSKYELYWCDILNIKNPYIITKKYVIVFIAIFKL